MKLETWLRLQVIFSQLKKGNLMVLFYGRVIGSSWYDEYVEVFMKRKKLEIVLEYKNLPYNREEFSKSFEEGYIVGHPLTNRKVKRTVYKTKIFADNKGILVESTNPKVRDFFKRQFDAIDFMDKKVFEYKDYKVDFSSAGKRGLSYSDTKKSFNNVIDYNNYEIIEYFEESV